MTSTARTSIVYLIVCSILILIVARMISLQLLPKQQYGYDFLQKQADARHIRALSIPAARGSIFDRNGEPLALSLQATDVFIDPTVFAKHNSWLLAKILDIDLQQFEAKLALYQHRRFMYVKRGILSTNPILNELSQIKGVHQQTTYKRYYPEGEIISQLIGVSDVNDIGRDGLELVYNKYLVGQNGEQLVIRDLKSRNVEILGIKKPPVPGNNLTLSIDLRLQHSAYKAIKKAVINNQAKGAMTVALDVNTGEVLAMSSYPSYNPNNRTNIDISAMRNRVVTDLFEPGSTIKPLTLIAALEGGYIDIDDRIDTNPGVIRIGRKNIYDPVNYGVISIGKLIQKSSQVGIVKVSQNLPITSLTTLLQHLGLGSYSGLGFPGELSGGIAPQTTYSDLDKAILSYGYSIQVNLLQLARAYAILANQGERMEVTISKSFDNEQQGQSIISNNIAQQVIALLQLVSETGGTAEKASVNGYKIAGKTGTSRQVTNGKYNEDIHNSLFVGFAPAESPKIVVAVLVNNPNNIEYSGGEVAAPVFSEIMADALRFIQINNTLVASQSF